MTDSDQIFRTAFADHKNGNLNKAAAGYSQVLSDQPTHPSALHLLGLIEYDWGNIKNALPLIEQSIKLVPDDLQWQLNFGDILSQTGQKKQAVSVYKNALTIDPECIAAKLSLGDLYIESENFHDALLIYYKILCDNLSEPEIAEKYSHTLKLLGKNVEAEAFSFWIKTMQTHVEPFCDNYSAPRADIKYSQSPNVFKPKNNLEN